jgi:hypothetical protein
VYDIVLYRCVCEWFLNVCKTIEFRLVIVLKLICGMVATLPVVRKEKWPLFKMEVDVWIGFNKMNLFGMRV